MKIKEGMRLSLFKQKKIEIKSLTRYSKYFQEIGFMMVTSDTIIEFVNEIFFIELT